MICPSATMTARWMEWKHCLRYQHSLLGGNRSRWLSKVRLCTTARERTLQRKSVWAVSAYFEYWRTNFYVTQEQISVLYVVLTDYVCYAQTLCVLNTDANFEDCRQGFHVSQIQSLVCCMVASNCVSRTHTLCLQHRQHCTSLDARNWCWGSLGSLENRLCLVVLEV